MVMRDHLDPQLLKLGISVPNCELLPVEKLNRMLARETRRFANQAVSYELPPAICVYANRLPDACYCPAVP